MIKKLSVLALVLLIIGGTGTVLTFSRSNTVVQISEEKTFSGDAIQTVQIETDNADVEVMPTEESAVRVELAGKGNPDNKITFDADVEGDTLVVNLEEKQQKFFTIGFISSDVTLNVYLPKSTYESLSITNRNGRVQLSQLSSKKVNVRVNNGQVNAKNIASEAVMVQADNGKISLDHVDGTINGRVSNGSIKVATKDLDRSMQLKSNNGSITVQTEKEPTNTTFNVHKDNGEINILNKYSEDTRFGDGKNVIELTTNNGKITVTK